MQYICRVLEVNDYICENIYLIKHTAIRIPMDNYEAWQYSREFKASYYEVAYHDRINGVAINFTNLS